METESIEEAEDEFKFDSNTITIIVIVFAVGMILASAYLIISEINGAKTSCEEIGMEYKFNFPYEHLCNGKEFFKYSDGWSFETEVNISEFLFP